MLKVSKNDSVRTQLNGNWLLAKVADVDASLIMLQYPSGNLEWIYRGSERLGAIITENVSFPPL